MECGGGRSARHHTERERQSSSGRSFALWVTTVGYGATSLLKQQE
jgi:hypothetical protein